MYSQGYREGSIHPLLPPPQIYRQCNSHELSVETFNELCQRSSLRLIKVLRVGWLSTMKQTYDVLPWGVPVVHVIRHPAMVLKSAAHLGWYVDFDQAMAFSSDEELQKIPAFHRPAAYHAHEICREMLDTHHAVSAHRFSNQPALVLKLEVC
eukprot:m.252364 g.252364  ORF g.252364 m.252364 type:complete len:152 (+) comp54521_c0_seq3:550-1005(+)